MNTYRTEFFAFCPSNGVRVKYDLTIETTETIMVEQIVDEVTLHSKGYHEQIADDLFRSFGGRQALVAHHHGVDIETRRPMGPCVTCAGSGMVDRTGHGDLQACACRTPVYVNPTHWHELPAFGITRPGGVKGVTPDRAKELLRSDPRFRAEWYRLYDDGQLPDDDAEAISLVSSNLARKDRP